MNVFESHYKFFFYIPTSINSLTKVSPLHNVTRGIFHNTWGGSQWPFHLEIPPGALNMTTNSGEPGLTLDLLPKFCSDTADTGWHLDLDFYIISVCFFVFFKKAKNWSWNSNPSVFVSASPQAKRLPDLTTYVLVMVKGGSSFNICAGCWRTHSFCPGSSGLLVPFFPKAEVHAEFRHKWMQSQSVKTPEWLGGVNSGPLVLKIYLFFVAGIAFII